MTPPDVVMDIDEALAFCDDDPQFLRIILEQYWRLWPDTRMSIEQAVAGQDRLALRKIVHKLKGQAGFIAARQVEAATSLLEYHSEEAPCDRLQTMVDSLLTAQQNLRAFQIESNLVEDDVLPPV